VFRDINYFDIEYDEDGAEGNVDDTGYGLGFGLRSMISDKVELEGMINWTRANSMMTAAATSAAMKRTTPTRPERRWPLSLDCRTSRPASR
jgi:hypothetical protein